jgi:hypothetical protein
VGVVAVLGLLGAGCSDDAGGGDEGASSGSTASTSTTTTPSTGPTAATTGTTAPPEASRPTAFTAQARDAVNELKAAWEEGDDARARAIAPGEVVEALFPIPPDGFEVYGCDTGEFETSTCSFRNRSTGVYITVTSTRTEPGWQVTSLFVDGG